MTIGKNVQSMYFLHFEGSLCCLNPNSEETSSPRANSKSFTYQNNYVSFVLTFNDSLRPCLLIGYPQRNSVFRHSSGLTSHVLVQVWSPPNLLFCGTNPIWFHLCLI